MISQMTFKFSHNYCANCLVNLGFHLLILSDGVVPFLIYGNFFLNMLMIPIEIDLVVEQRGFHIFHFIFISFLASLLQSCKEYARLMLCPPSSRFFCYVFILFLIKASWLYGPLIFLKKSECVCVYILGRYEIKRKILILKNKYSWNIISFLKIIKISC